MSTTKQPIQSICYFRLLKWTLLLFFFLALASLLCASVIVSLSHWHIQLSTKSVRFSMNGTRSCHCSVLVPLLLLRFPVCLWASVPHWLANQYRNVLFWICALIDGVVSIFVVYAWIFLSSLSFVLSLCLVHDWEQYPSVCLCVFIFKSGTGIGWLNNGGKPLEITCTHTHTRTSRSQP